MVAVGLDKYSLWKGDLYSKNCWGSFGLVVMDRWSPGQVRLYMGGSTVVFLKGFCVIKYLCEY